YFHMVKEELKSENFAPNSQIIIDRNYLKTHGFFHWSTGCIRNLLNRDDIFGIIGNEKNFYNPMNGNTGRRWGYYMSGIDLEYPTHLYNVKKISDRITLSKYQYALQWFQDTKNSKWIIHKVDTITGYSYEYLKGEGWEEYDQTLKNLKNSNINQTDILFGGPPMKSDSLRLGL
ncbi:hypothetical protein ACFLS9_10665, partial [Bacteroidota bacterium]